MKFSDLTKGWSISVNNYESRKIGNYRSPCGKFRVSTAEVYDGKYPYETLVVHSDYEPDNAIVEAYSTIEAAKKGHAKWLRKMKSKNLPKKIKDCNNSNISQLFEPILGETFMMRKE